MFDDFNDILRHIRGFIDLPPSAESRELSDSFNLLALRLFSIQFQENPIYAAFCRSRKIIPGTITEWQQIPALPISAFKEFDVTLLKSAMRIFRFHSSGTTQRLLNREAQLSGLKAGLVSHKGNVTSVHYHHEESMALYERSVVKGFELNVLPHIRKLVGMPRMSPNGNLPQPDESSVTCRNRWPVHLLLLTPPPVQAPHSSLVHMLATWDKQFYWASSCWAGTLTSEGEWALSGASVIAVMEQSIATGLPLIIMGTAFNYVQVMEHFSKQGTKLILPTGSCVMETGGYKGQTRALSRSELYAGITDSLGIPTANIFSEYGMCELSSQAYDTPASSITVPADAFSNLDARSWRFPFWARARIISPETGLEAGEGEIGLLQVFDLANAWSAMAIQTEDLAVRCRDGFQLMGRAAQASLKGCSLNISL